MEQEILLKEKYGCLGAESVYVKPADQDSVIRIDESKVRSGSQRSNILLFFKQFFNEVFLPQGYPYTVSDDYWSYQYWDTVQAFCSSICGSLTTHAIMKGVGVGDTAATPLAAAVTWILKDGTGMTGRIAFAWWKGSRLDAECKAWRLMADVLNDIAMLAEMLLPYVPNYTTIILCASQSAKAIVGVAGGATRAAITQHQAIRGNMGDVSAKDGSQETCINLLASFVGIFLLTTVTNAFCVWALFIILASCHIYANYQAVLSLRLVSLNTERMNLILKHYFSSKTEVPTPREVNAQESIIPGSGLTTKQLCGFDIYLGCSLQHSLKNRVISAEELKSMPEKLCCDNFMLLIDPENCIIRVVFREHESAHDVIQAYFTAVCMAIMLSVSKTTRLAHLPDSAMINKNPGRIMSDITQPYDFLVCTGKSYSGEIPSEEQIAKVLESNNEISKTFKIFMDLLETQGWKTDRHHFIVDEWRASWPLYRSSDNRSETRKKK
nr:PREDICTED: RUS1 family protein C16orf58 homolog [Bemisia tabaci]XP_018895983.1 PREDICTED: RUS1 family protein C16orf58 homolog [Bemisia tabaci]XP_018895985.1 PREDICTED: RUS1 family protein C16orf58 homolog [Bemisia tabaci]